MIELSGVGGWILRTSPIGVEELKSLVDTGATFTKVPLGVGERLGSSKKERVLDCASSSGTAQ